jgi:DNA mismatch repair protein MSH2
VDLAKVQGICDAAAWGCKLDGSLKKAATAKADLEQDVRRLVGGAGADESRSTAVASAISMVDEFPVAAAALAGLVSHESLLSREDDIGAYVLSSRALGDSMRLDNAAMKALTLFPQPGSSGGMGGGGGPDSVLALLQQHALSSGGGRLLRRWLAQPLIDIRRIRMRQGAVGLLVKDVVLRDSLREALRIPDLEGLARRVHRRTASLLDVCRMYQGVTALSSLIALLEGPAREAEEMEEGGGVSSSDEGVHKSLIGRLLARLEWCSGELSQFEKMVEKVIVDPTDSEPRVSPAWDPSLSEAAAEMDECLALQQAVYRDATRSGGWGDGLDLKLEKDKVHGLVFRCNRKHDRLVREVPHVHVASVLKDGIRFTTTGGKHGGLKTVSVRTKEAQAVYNERQAGVVSSAIEVVRTYTGVIEAAATALAELDALRAMACAATAGAGVYVRPTMVEGGGTPSRLSVTNARHPVIESREATGAALSALTAVGGGTGFVPNSYSMGADSGGLLHIITGPNMGGKSTYIRTLGTLAVMAQAGCFLPAEEAVLPVFDSIQARVGAGDAQVRGISTFMAEMLEAASILECATPASLVIVDELGRGTSTYDGFGLAWAIAERLAAETKCLTLFATHFHELTALEDAVPAGIVRNRHVTAAMNETLGSKGLTMLYTVAPGPCPSSFGVHVAALAGFPDAVIAEASSKADELERLAKRGRAILESKDTASYELALALSAAGEETSRERTLEAAREAVRQFVAASK